MERDDIIDTYIERYAELPEDELNDIIHKQSNNRSSPLLAAAQVVLERKKRNEENERFEAALSNAKRSQRIALFSVVVALLTLILYMIEIYPPFE